VTSPGFRVPETFPRFLGRSASASGRIEADCAIRSASMTANASLAGFNEHHSRESWVAFFKACVHNVCSPRKECGQDSDQPCLHAL